MTSQQPPRTLSALWCPACGALRLTERQDPRGGAHVGAQGGTCTALRQVVQYTLPRVPEPLPALTDGDIRAAVAVEVAIRPGLAHLDGGALTFVGRTVQYRANTVEQVADLAGLILRDIAQGLPDAIAAHPRPEPEGWQR